MSFISCHATALIGPGGGGDNGGTEIRLSWLINAFGDDGYNAGFGNSDFAPTGGDLSESGYYSSCVQCSN